ncbi:MAG: DUF3579 domain-containing protein [Gammaproteobacteria bacterium]|nr:MAG: DUF3579 domain-containing protein [Gammaproteobacteria bacterium]
MQQNPRGKLTDERGGKVMPQEQKLVVESVRRDGRPFRPADWVERISSQLAGFGPDHRLRYSEYVHPCVIAGMKCLVLKRSLREQNPAAYEFILKFARDNQLSIQEDRRAQHSPPLQERRKEG